MFILKSPGYKDGQRLPNKYANFGVNGGQNISPPFEWEGAPGGTKSFALAIVDHHPVANEFVHWLLIDIPVDFNAIEEGGSGEDKLPAGAKQLNTTYNTPTYGGPRPPKGTGDHPYEATIYALNVAKLGLSENANFADFEIKIEGKVTAKASIIGLFSQ